MAYDVVHADVLEREERETADGSEPRRHAPVTEAAQLTQSRAHMWRYPAHTRGRLEFLEDVKEI